MQRYFSDKLKDNKFELREDDMYHITRVMRMTSGDKIEVVCNENVYLCCLESVNNKLEVNVISVSEKEEKEIREKVLIIPLLKEVKMDLQIVAKIVTKKKEKEKKEDKPFG